MQVNVHEAKSQLSKLIERALHGEEVVIAKAGKPVVKLVRIKPGQKRVLGSAAGSIEYADGWDAPLTDQELDDFLGR
jgi:prevent-host-death family protein